MGTLSGDGYYQDADEARYYDSWQGARDIDAELNQNNPKWIQPPDSYYRDRHVPAKQAIMNALHEGQARRAAEDYAASLGGTLSADGLTILIPIMTPEEKVTAQDVYAVSKAAKVGQQISCACCGKLITKTNYQQAFCPPVNGRRGKRYVCKDRYWNLTVPERAARANQWGGK